MVSMVILNNHDDLSTFVTHMLSHYSYYYTNGEWSHLMELDQFKTQVNRSKSVEIFYFHILNYLHFSNPVQDSILLLSRWEKYLHQSKYRNTKVQGDRTLLKDYFLVSLLIGVPFNFIWIYFFCIWLTLMSKLLSL